MVVPYLLKKKSRLLATDDNASNAGIVKTPQARYTLAPLSSLGSRCAPHERCATSWRPPALGAAVHRIVTAAR